jgi:hypothetical protein
MSKMIAGLMPAHGEKLLMPVNNFKPFAIGSGQTWRHRLTGNLVAVYWVYSGHARSGQVNKALAGNVIASVLAQFISDQSDVDVLDDGDMDKLEDSCGLL